MVKGKLLLLLLLAATALTALAGEAPSPFCHGRLTVAPSGRYLQHADGTPFLYLGDTAWELFARLTYEEACYYLDNRAAKGFTVIQTVVITELEDYTPPTEHYLAHIDSVLTYAEQRGLYLALLPTWGDKVDRQWGKGPEVFTHRNAYAYGRRLARRWHTRPNIIWVLGGDRSGEGRNRTVWNRMAQGIRSIDQNHLMTYHPQGEHSSSMWFHQEEWLDFNMVQTGHCQETYDIYRRLLLPDWQRTPVKPVMDGEPRYEDIPRHFKAAEGRFQAIDVRHTLYQSMLSGACGYTYGNNNIWQMYTPGREAMCDANRAWREALDMEGACQLIHFVRLWQDIPFPQGHPLPDCIQPAADETPENKADEAVAFETDDWMVCYFPGGRQWTVTLPARWADGYHLQWLDPRTGIRQEAGDGHQCHLTLQLPPAPLGSPDWVLLIRRLPAPNTPQCTTH